MTDPDSTPGNSNASEDDQATATVTPLASVTGHVFQDPNGNGVQDTGEAGIAQHLQGVGRLGGER